MKSEFDRLISPVIGMSGHFVRQEFHIALFLWQPEYRVTRTRPNKLQRNTLTFWLCSHYWQIWF